MGAAIDQPPAPRASAAAGFVHTARTIAVVLGAIVLAGCAWLRGPATATADPAAAEEPAGPPVVNVTIDAPEPLRSLLERHLDLSRLARLTRGDAVTDTELTRLLDAAPAQVRELAQTEGYFRPEVRIHRTLPARAGDTESVVLTVAPGPLARVARVTLQVEGALERDAAAGDAHASATIADWRTAWPLTAGTPFRNTDWSDAKAAALTRLRNAGYAAAAWSGTAADVDAATGDVRLFLVADSGPLFRAGEIRIEGLERHDERTVRDLAGFERGTPVTEALLLDYQERLQKSGLFDSATVTLDADPARAGAATVQARVHEQTIQIYTFGVGISANTGPRASVEHAHRRVFGWPVAAHNKLEYGKLRQAWTGEVSTHPGPGFTRWLLGGAVERLLADEDNVLSQRLRFGRTSDSRRLERLMFAEVEHGQRSTATSERDIYAVSGNYHVTLRRLDSVVLPTDGYTLSLQAGVGHSWGSDTKSGIFTRAYGRFTLYRPLGNTWYGQARVELGKVFLPRGVGAPDSQLFRAGGDDSVRGYEYRSLGPLTDAVVGSGSMLATGSIELARPLSAALPSWWGAVFVDAGNAANDWKALRPVFGYGVGVRWRSPVGPLRLDVAWGQETRKLRLHFSVGIAF